MNQGSGVRHPSPTTTSSPSDCESSTSLRRSAILFGESSAVSAGSSTSTSTTSRRRRLSRSISCSQSTQKLDALISAADGTRTIIEVKLTERAFGTARADIRHLAKLNDIYRPLLAGRIADSCFEPTSFFRDYQLYRNLAQVRLGTSDRVLLLLLKARTQLWRHAVAWCQSPLLGPLGVCVQAVALEDVVSALAEDSRGLEDPNDVAAEVSRKYIPAAG